MNESTPTVPTTTIDPGADELLDGRSTAEILEHLATTAEDGAKGFAQAADHVDDAATKTLFRELGEERARLAQDMRSFVLTRYQQYVSDSGSVKAALHRGWIALKDAMTGDDPYAVIAAAEEGEDYALEQYDEALAKPLASDAKAKVREQRDIVLAAHNRVRQLKRVAE